MPCRAVVAFDETLPGVSLAHTAGVPSSVVNGVNVMTGSYVETHRDLETTDVAPLPFDRCYHSANVGADSLQTGWWHNHSGYGYLYMENSRTNKKGCRIGYRDPSGHGVRYVAIYPETEKFTVALKPWLVKNPGLTNCYQKPICGQTNQKNMAFTVVKDSEGVQKIGCSYAYNDIYCSQYFQAGMETAGGMIEVATGYGACLSGIGAAPGGLLIAHGADHFATGVRTLWTGVSQQSMTSQLLEGAGCSPTTAAVADSCINMFSPQSISMAFNKVSSSAQAAYKSFTRRNFRHNVGVKTGVPPKPGVDAHHILPIAHEKQFVEAGTNIHDPKHGALVNRREHQLKAADYNKDWEDFFRRNSTFTEHDAMKEGQKLMRIHHPSGITSYE